MIKIQRDVALGLLLAYVIHLVHPEIMKWTFLSLNLDMSIIENRDVSQNSKHNSKQCRS